MNETKKVSRRKYTAEFKAKVALEAMQENQTLPELCSKYQFSPNQVNQWKKRLRERSAEAFRADTNGRDEKDRLIEQLYKTIGELTMDVEFLKKSCFHECRAALRDGLQGGEAEHTPSVRASRPVPRHVLLHPGENTCDTCKEPWKGMAGYFDFYNNRRLRQSLGYQCPATVYMKKRVA